MFRFSVVEVVAALLRSGIDVRLSVRGPSMAPTLRTGDTIILGAGSAGTLQPGDLAVFRAGDRLYAHRFLGRGVGRDGEPLLHFAGDACVDQDPPVEPSEVLARIVRIERQADRPLSVTRLWNEMGQVSRRALAAMNLLSGQG